MDATTPHAPGAGRKYLATVLCLALACSGALFTITLEEQAQIVITEGSLLENLVGDLGFGAFINQDITAAEELENQGVSKGDIEGVQLVELSMTMIEPPDADFDFLEVVDFYVEAPELPRVLIASSKDVPVGARQIEFTIPDVDLTPYALSQSMTFNTEVSGRRPEQDVRVQASYALDVGVTGQGCKRAVRER